MDFGPIVDVAASGGATPMYLFLIGAFIYAILRGHLEPRATSKRVEEVLEKRYVTLQSAYELSEAARHEALAVATAALEVQRTSLAVLEELRRAAEAGGSR